MRARRPLGDLAIAVSLILNTSRTGKSILVGGQGTPELWHPRHDDDCDTHRPSGRASSSIDACLLITSDCRLTYSSILRTRIRNSMPTKSNPSCSQRGRRVLLLPLVFAGSLNAFSLSPTSSSLVGQQPPFSSSSSSSSSSLHSTMNNRGNDYSNSNSNNRRYARSSL